MDTSEYRPTGAEIDDHKLLYGTDSIMGPWTAACWMWVILVIVFFVGSLFGFAAKALIF